VCGLGVGRGIGVFAFVFDFFVSFFSFCVCSFCVCLFVHARACGLEDNIFHIKRNVWVGRGDVCVRCLVAAFE